MAHTAAHALRRDAVRNRDELLACAQREIARDPRASLATIAQAAGLTRRALYGHFSDRDTLVRAVIERGAERFNAIANGVAAAEPLDELTELTTRLWHEASLVHASAAIALEERYLSLTAASLAPLRARLTAIVEDGQRTGQIRRDISAATLTRLIEETARTLIVRWDQQDAEVTAHLPVRAVLSIAGLSWQDVEARLANAPTKEASGAR
ncbi:TetR family transcriptional regulator [Microbacterium schleiferi]|jgi:AcrR family transcriptional regulator|uniref:TetR family transcriptional regulator n=1 Tax=Microbacterium schleiferi TaxID=69362 RepID=UPI00311F4F22